MRSASTVRALAALALTGALGAADAAEWRILVQRSSLAGFHYHAAAEVWPELAVGAPLELVREPDNPHDPNAVRVEWAGRKLGYIPRKDNAALAWALDRGERVHARIAALHEHPNPRERLKLEVFAE